MNVYECIYKFMYICMNVYGMYVILCMHACISALYEYD